MCVTLFTVIRGAMHVCYPPCCYQRCHACVLPSLLLSEVPCMCVTLLAVIRGAMPIACVLTIVVSEMAL